MLIRDWRIKNQWSQAQLAKKLGISQQSVSRMERGLLISARIAIELERLSGGQLRADRLNGLLRLFHDLKLRG